ncbi:3995_t:CDS:1, partial [Funneliformis geosporum]
MDSGTYFSLIQYLTDFNMPKYLTKEQQQMIKRKSQYFILINGQLYKKNRIDPQRPYKV